MTDEESSELEELWDLFREEGNDALNSSEEALLELQSDLTNKDHISTLFRGIHSFKGMSRMMGMSNIESIAHVTEDLIGMVRESEIVATNDIVTITLSAVDLFRELLETCLQSRADVDHSQISEMEIKLKEFIKNSNNQVEDDLDISSAEFFDDNQDFVNDPVYIKLFTEIVDSEVDKLNKIIQSNNDVDKLEIEKIFDSIKLAATNMNFNNIVESLSKISISDDKDTLRSTISIIKSLCDCEDDSVISCISVNVKYMPAFLEVLEDDFTKLYTILSKDDDISKFSTAIKETVAHIIYAAKQMHCDEIVVILEALVTSDYTWLTTDKLHNIESNIHEIADKLMVEKYDISDDILDPTSVFISSYANQMFSNITNLNNLLDSIENKIELFMSNSSDNNTSGSDLYKIESTLRNIYHGCLFYKMNIPAHLTLIVQDLFARVVQDGITCTKSLIDFTHRYANELQDAIVKITKKQDYNNVIFDELTTKAKAILFKSQDQYRYHSTILVLNMLGFTADKLDYLTPQNMDDLGVALQSGEHFYSVLADLNADDDIALQFMEWSESEYINIVTSTSVIEDDKSWFNFFLTSIEPEEIISADIKKIDPTGKILQFSSCAVVDEKSLWQSEDCNPVNPNFTPTSEHSKKVDNNLLFDSIGQLVNLLTSLSHMARSIGDTNLVNDINEKLLVHNHDTAKAKPVVENIVESWIADVQNELNQMSYQLSETLEKCREYSVQVSELPLISIIDTINRYSIDLSNYYDKHVKIEFNDFEGSIDLDLLRVLELTLKDILWFSIVYSIECDALRKEEGKQFYSSIKIKLKHTAKKISCTVTDDGLGFNSDKVLLALNSQFADFNQLSTADKIDLIFHSNFSDKIKCHDTDAGVDFAAIQRNLAKYNGNINLNLDNSNLDLEFSLPLSQVILDGMVVEVGNINYIIPVIAIQRILSLSSVELLPVSSSGGNKLLQLEDQVIPLTNLSRGKCQEEKKQLVLVVVEHESKLVAFPVDKLIGQEQILIKSFKGQLSDIPCVSGYGLLGSGDISVVVDLNQIVNKVA